MHFRESEAWDTFIRSRQRNEWIQQMSDNFPAGEPVSTYVCECGDTECAATIRLTPAEYERIRSVGTRFVIHTNHENPEIDMVTEENSRWSILEKLPGESAREAERSDPRRPGGDRGAMTSSVQRQQGSFSPGSESNAALHTATFEPAPEGVADSPERDSALMSLAATEPRSRRPVPAATVRHAGRVLKLERRITLLITLLPFAGAAAGIPLLWNRGVRALDLTLFVALYVITGMGVTVGFHRMLTHRSFETVTPVKVILAICGSMAVQGSVISWVADHRRHHAYTDKPGDPHSPHLEEAEGVKGVLKGLWHAHTGWFFNPEKTNIEKFAPDLLRDKAILKVSNWFPLLAVISFALPAVIGLAVTRTWIGAVTAFVWGGLARIFFLHHVTWSINSICHFYGKRPFRSSDLSTNNWVMALLSFGEGWHNAHHAFPSSYKHGLERLQFDPSAWLIKGLHKLGLVYNIKLPTPAQLAAKRTAPSSAQLTG